MTVIDLADDIDVDATLKPVDVMANNVDVTANDVEIPTIRFDV
jgi:hypothetical protein